LKETVDEMGIPSVQVAIILCQDAC